MINIYMSILIGMNDLCNLTLEFIGSWDDYHNFEHIINTVFAPYSKLLSIISVILS